MDLKNAECIWDSLNELHKNDKQAYEKFMKKHMDEMSQMKPIKPKFGYCVMTDVEKVSICTQTNEYTEKLCNYFIYIYYTKNMKEPILPSSLFDNLDKINFDHIYISTCKIKGESSKDMYAEAVIHSIIYKQMNNVKFKNIITTHILETINANHITLKDNIKVNINSFKYIELDYIPKTTHFLNPHCINYTTTDNNNINSNNNSNKNSVIDENDIKFYNILNEKQNKINNNNYEDVKKNKPIKLHDTSNDILNEIQTVRTTKKSKNDAVNLINIPKQVKSYNYTIIDRFLHIILTFNNIAYEDLEILKNGNNIDIYVSSKIDECMPLHFKENLSDNVKHENKKIKNYTILYTIAPIPCIYTLIKGYFNEKSQKLTLSVELLY
ncbi:conserved protein, unknown function [Hepatocystis sp. ex Piliocolobus tephrosceles]|nr:conserved protein, unknown function [Hepatocystis sp. ex Piliocolobus tephrosceles]